MPDWRFAWVLWNGRWDADGASLITEALESGDWSVVVEFAEVIDWDGAAAC